MKTTLTITTIIYQSFVTPVPTTGKGGYSRAFSSALLVHINQNFLSVFIDCAIKINR